MSESNDMTGLSEVEDFSRPEDLLEPQSYPDPSFFSQSLYELPQQEREFQEQLISNEMTLRAIAPYLQIIVKSGQNKVESVICRKRRSRMSIYKKSKCQVRHLVLNVLDKPQLIKPIEETANILKTIVRSSTFDIYLVDPLHNEIIRYPTDARPTTVRTFKIELKTTMAAYCAYQKTHTISENIQADPRFPRGVGVTDSQMKFALCVPIMMPNGRVAALFELTRGAADSIFDKHDIQVMLAVTSWMGIGIHQNLNYTSVQRQHELSDYLQQLTMQCQCKETKLNTSLSFAVLLAKKTIGAERCVIYVVAERHETWFEVEEYVEKPDDSKMLLKRLSRLRIEADNGTLLSKVIVEKTIQTINTGGYSTICVPILCNCNEILAALELSSNRFGRNFDSGDNETLQLFANYLPVILHCENRADRLSTIECSGDAIRSMLYHHITPKTHDQKTTSEGSAELPEGFFTFSWYPSPDDTPRLTELAVTMFHKILGTRFMLKNDVPKFISTVKNCYRPNPYHNFLHAFSVTHAMANIISRYNHIFNGVERKGLMIAALCHDLDHRGYTNNFVKVTNHYLSRLYESSPLENHHFAVAKTILEICSMFKYLEKEIYDQLITEIYKSIVATDLALYFQCRMELAKISDKNNFTFKSPKNRSLVKGFLMTACDLSGQAKPIDICMKITEDLYEEFFQQGDLEKRMGLIPIPTMDREQKDLFLENQIQFVNIVVIPCFQTVAGIFTSMTPMLEDTVNTLNKWKELLATKQKRDKKLELLLAENKK